MYDIINIYFLTMYAYYRSVKGMNFKMKKVLFICALEKEGRQIAERLEMREISGGVFENKEKNQGLIITGMGK